MWELNVSMIHQADTDTSYTIPARMWTALVTGLCFGRDHKVSLEEHLMLVKKCMVK